MHDENNEVIIARETGKKFPEWLGEKLSARRAQ
jgi:hypothetical protein